MRAMRDFPVGGQHWLALVLLVGVTLAAQGVLRLTGYDEALTAPQEGVRTASQSADRVWARVLLIYPGLR